MRTKNNSFEYIGDVEMGLNESFYEQQYWCKTCNKETTFSMNQWDDDKGLETAGMCNTCEQQEIHWINKLVYTDTEEDVKY